MYKLTKQQIQEEILKCGKNPGYFINTYCKISHPQKGPIPFRMYPFQHDVIKDFQDHRFNVILKARQLGLSTVVAGYVAWLMLFHRDKNVLVLATKLMSASNVVRKVKYIIKSVPTWLMIATIEIDNRTSFELSNGSQIKSSATSGDAGRSEALSLLVLDEAGFIESMQELWTGLYPTMATGGKCIALSTPNGVGNWFHQTYVDAESASNEFNPIKLHWSVHPDRNPEWFARETKNLSKREIAQEYECSFNASGETVVEADALEHVRTGCEEPKLRLGVDKNLWIWKEYYAKCKYLCVADVARGDGKDFSVFHLLNLDTMEQVAEYQGKLNSEDFARLLYNTGTQYGSCMIIVENNNLGYAVLEKLISMGYKNIYYSSKGTAEFVEQHAAEGMSNIVPGFTTSHKSRPLIISKLEEFIRSRFIKLNSIRSYNELTTFIWYHGRPQAMNGYNDDLVISLAIACWVKDTVFQSATIDIEYQKAILTSMTKSNKVLNTSIPGMLHYNVNTKLADDVLRQRDLQKDFLWIFKG